ncbi:uncharacterized protein LOC132311451 [Cornus florida]|uniref:uncharacterized protein LOC132311451 n=1 Tax=Cornus florida TaxID=4283 RepID=UPI00289DA790|nr:uncharacterized protein LOC132311451 [Cornus florida]
MAVSFASVAITPTKSTLLYFRHPKASSFKPNLIRMSSAVSGQSPPRGPKVNEGVQEKAGCEISSVPDAFSFNSLALNKDLNRLNRAISDCLNQLTRSKAFVSADEIAVVLNVLKSLEQSDSKLDKFRDEMVKKAQELKNIFIKMEQHLKREN